MKRKFSISKTIQLNKNAGEVEQALFQLLHEMGYRIVTAYHWELAGPSVLGIYRIKWIPKRYINIELNAPNTDTTEITFHLSYYLKQKKYKDRIYKIFKSELDIISEILQSEKKQTSRVTDLELKSLVDESVKFRNAALTFALLIALVGIISLTISLEKNHIIWAFMLIFFVQVLIVLWFRKQDL